MTPTAYYDPSLKVYYSYPAGSDTPTTCATLGATPNTANCDAAEGDFTIVTAYTGSASPSGTYDQGGNVWEWTETALSSYRVTRGGSFDVAPSTLAGLRAVRM